MKNKNTVLFLLCMLLLLPLSFASIQYVDPTPAQGSTLYQTPLSNFTYNITSVISNFSNMTIQVYNNTGDRILLNYSWQPNVSRFVDVSTFGYGLYDIYVMADNGSTVLLGDRNFTIAVANPNTHIINWDNYFIGFDDLGTIVGTFVSNFLIAILPVLLIGGLIFGFFVLIRAVFSGVGGMLKFHKYK